MCGSVNLPVVHLNIKKNNNIGVLRCFVVFTMSHTCVNLPNLLCYTCGKITTSHRENHYLYSEGV